MPPTGSIALSALQHPQFSSFSSAAPAVAVPAYYFMPSPDVPPPRHAVVTSGAGVATALRQGAQAVATGEKEPLGNMMEALPSPAGPTRKSATATTGTIHRDSSLHWHCRFCAYKSPFRSTVVIHERSHTGEKPYACSSCAYR
jgi:hypothetical protein